MPELAALVARLDALEQRVQETEQVRAEAEEKAEHYKQLYLSMLERCRKLERGLLGQKAERLPDGEGGQLSLEVLALMLDEESAAELAEPEPAPSKVKGHTRKKPTGRKPIPEELPRVDIEVLPEEVQREGLDAFERIGEEVSEVIERRPASMVAVRIIKPKFIRKGRRDRPATKVFVGATPERPIPKSVAGPGLLADTLVRRWQDHLPLHRLEGIYEREGVGIARSTICGWHLELCDLVEPLVAAMRQEAFEQPYLCVDATGVLVQAKHKCRTGHFWVMVAPERHVLFEYTRDHTNDAVDSVLAGYEGYLVADAHVVYDHLYAGGHLTEVNCWAHARRYFFKAVSTDPERAKVALGHIGALFKIERSLKNAPRKKRERIRKKHSQPIVERFFSWCEEVRPHLIDETPIADGVRYAINQKEGLKTFLRDGRLPLSNNISERHLRTKKLGQKNWLFLGSDDGGRANALFTSLLASCRMLGVEPWAYLRDLLCLLPRWPIHRVLELAPFHWPVTRERDEVIAKLEADPYRTVTLGRGDGA